MSLLVDKHTFETEGIPTERPIIHGMQHDTTLDGLENSYTHCSAGWRILGLASPVEFRQSETERREVIF